MKMMDGMMPVQSCEVQCIHCLDGGGNGRRREPTLQADAPATGSAGNTQGDRTVGPEDEWVTIRTR